MTANPADPRTALAEARITLAELLNRTNATAAGCREWQGWKRRRGYGGIKVNKVEWAAHRLAYTLEYGPIPEGQLVLHRCDNPPCINPAHLFLGTQHDNIQDAVSKGKFPKRTHCKRGHELTPENSVLAGYGRTCRICRQASNRERSQRRRARLVALSAAVEGPEVTE
jgi:hypothetical protein